MQSDSETVPSRPKKEDLSSWDSSPQMANLIFSTFDHSSCLEVDQVFVQVLNNGGIQELDFLREPGVPFNPRPARIAYIQLVEAKNFEKELLIESLKACSLPYDALDSKLLKVFHWLDRARHVHMVEDQNQRLNLFRKMYLESMEQLETTTYFNIPLENKIKLWQKRVAKSLSIVEQKE